MATSGGILSGTPKQKAIPCGWSFFMEKRAHTDVHNHETVGVPNNKRRRKQHKWVLLKDIHQNKNKILFTEKEQNVNIALRVPFGFQPIANGKNE